MSRALRPGSGGPSRCCCRSESQRLAVALSRSRHVPCAGAKTASRIAGYWVGGQRGREGCACVTRPGHQERMLGPLSEERGKLHFVWSTCRSLRSSPATAVPPACGTARRWREPGRGMRDGAATPRGNAGSAVAGEGGSSSLFGGLVIHSGTVQRLPGHLRAALRGGGERRGGACMLGPGHQERMRGPRSEERGELQFVRSTCHSLRNNPATPASAVPPACFSASGGCMARFPSVSGARLPGIGLPEVAKTAS